MALTTSIADHVVSLSTDGRIASQGMLSKVLIEDIKLAEELAEEREELQKADDGVDTGQPSDEEEGTKKLDGTLVIAEEISEGHVSWAARKYMHDDWS